MKNFCTPCGSIGYPRAVMPLGIVCLLIMLAVGCVAKMEPQPPLGDLSGLDMQATQARVRDILLWAKKPQITDVALDTQTLRYAYRQDVFKPLVYGLYGGRQETTKKHSIALADIATVDAYENHVVIVRNAKNAVLGTFVCLSADDARDLAHGLQAMAQHAQEVVQH